MKCKCSHRSFQLAQWCASLTTFMFVFVLPVQAEQFVLVDQTYTATKDNTQDSHFTAELKPDIPSNFRAPVDYASGSVHVRLEVQEMPSSKETFYNICLENSTNAACLPYVKYSMPGTYQDDLKFNSFWQYSAVDWTKGVTKVSLILKDNQEQKVQGDADYYPLKAHITLTVVAPGSTFDPSADHAGAAGAAGKDDQAGSGGTAGQGGHGGSGGAASQGGHGGTAGHGGHGGRSGARNTTAGGSGGANPNPVQMAQPRATADAGVAITAGAGAATTSNQNILMSQSGSAGSTASSNPEPVDLSAGAPTANDERPRTVRSALENTSGCAITGAGRPRAGAAWWFIALCLLPRRKRARHRQ